MFRRAKIYLCTGLLFIGCGISTAMSQQNTASGGPAKGRGITSSIEDKDAKQKARYEKFAKEMSGVKLIGTFTVDGRKGKLSEEEYTIDKVEKAPEGNLWTFTCRIKYGKIDVPVPLTIPVEWAGDTPMVGISNFKIPLVGSGVFGARVIFYDGKYAGTWSHDKVGGHMFGRIVKIEKETDDKK